MDKMINIIVSCCVKNDNKILFVQEKKKEINGLWNLPGGKSKPVEDIYQTAKREVLEETGYSIKLDSLLLIQNYVTDKGEMLIIYFNATLLNNKQKQYREKEIKDVKWLTLEEIKNIPKKNIRGGNGIDKIINNIERKIEYPLDIFNVYNYLK